MELFVMGPLGLGLVVRKGLTDYNRNMKERLQEDTRNLVDELKGLSNDEVKEKLGQRRVALEVAIENIAHDFNMGTIVRNANNFNVQAVHVIGRRKYNRRGAMCTDKYLEIIYWEKAEDFLEEQRLRGREVVAIENNVERSRPLGKKKFSDEATLLFGGESDGITPELIEGADDVRSIESFGSTRSVNVGVASGIAMYEWVRQRVIDRSEE